MQKLLIIIGVLIVLLGIVWPYLSKLGFGRLPGDILFKRDHVTIYIPLMSCLIASLVISLILWLFHR